MSKQGEKIPRTYALQAAQGICDRLEKICQRVQIAGSLRRGRAEVGDIEIVCIPRTTADLFGGEAYLWGDVRDALRDLVMVKGGDHYQQYELELYFAGRAHRVLMDVFVTSREQWGVIYTIRTGSADFAHRLVTQRTYGGYLPDGNWIHDGRLWKEGVSAETPEEEDLFREIGLKWVPPEKR